MVRHPFLPCAVLLMLLAADVALSLPRFAARTGSACQSCHVNPSGGSMRQAFGAQYGREELPVPAWSDDVEIEDFTNLIANVLGVGADFRTLFFTRQVPDSSGNAATTDNAFWQMQGDLYLNFRVTKKVQLYLKKGLYSGFEVFGLLHVLPERGHLKIGKFVPAYGMKTDDHTAFIRTYTGFSPAAGRPELTGLEAGIAPGPANIIAGLFNAADGFGGGTSKKALLLRAEGMFRLGSGSFLGVGGNVFRKELQTGATSTLYGGFGSLSLGDFTLLGELDLYRTAGSSASVTGILVYGEANYVVTPGVDLKVAYDFYDPDKDLKTGSISRYSFGFEFFPVSGVEVRPMYRVIVEEPKDVANNELHILFHIYL